MGDLQSEEERDIVLEIKLSPVDSPKQDLVLKTSLSYFNVIASTLDTVTFDLVIDRKGRGIICLPNMCCSFILKSFVFCFCMENVRT